VARFILLGYSVANSGKGLIYAQMLLESLLITRDKAELSPKPTQRLVDVTHVVATEA